MPSLSVLHAGYDTLDQMGMISPNTRDRISCDHQIETPIQRINAAVMADLPAVYRREEAVQISKPDDTTTVGCFLSSMMNHFIPCYFTKPQQHIKPPEPSVMARTYEPREVISDQPRPMPLEKTSPSKTDVPNLLLLHGFPTKSGVINIIQGIGEKYYIFGLHLLQDKNGDITEEIEEHYNQSNRITFAIIKMWLKGTGRSPKNWDTLVEVLRQIKLGKLAHEINSHLHHSHAE